MRLIGGVPWVWGAGSCESVRNGDGFAKEI